MFSVASSTRLISRARPVAEQLTKAFLSTSSSGTDVHLIINAVGKDRLGIVSDVTGLVIKSGGNVCDSQAAKLGPYFSLIMGVTLSSVARDSLSAQLAALPDMQAVVYEDDTAMEVLTPQIGYKGTFSLEGADNPGICHQITSALAHHGLSIDTMHTDQSIAPHGGTTLFRMNGAVTASAPLAAGFDANKIRNDLEEIGDSLNCDVSLDDA